MNKIIKYVIFAIKYIYHEYSLQTQGFPAIPAPGGQFNEVTNQKPLLGDGFVNPPRQGTPYRQDSNSVGGQGGYEKEVRPADREFGGRAGAEEHSEFSPARLNYIIKLTISINKFRSCGIDRLFNQKKARKSRNQLNEEQEEETRKAGQK